MRLTKLKIVQKIMSSLDLEEITTLGETVESEQVADIVDSTYDEINAEYPWPHLRGFTQLEVTATSHLMKLPTSVITINDVWYDEKEIKYVKPKEMVKLLYSRDTSESNVDANGAYNNRDPLYWSSYDDTNIVFDAYDGTLVSASSLIDAFTMPAQMIEDSDYPVLPERYHNLLYYGAMADAAYTLKGDTTNFNIYRNRFKRVMNQMQRWAKRVNRESATGDNINYGRKWA